ncbi:MAG: glutamate synthase large subunit [Campylobacteraceae bacterium 4484_166]|nr:MAG: glutamate synthase large subunit [Campylobacteraceae bacterium 4484_166]
MASNLNLLTSFKDNCGFGLICDLQNRFNHKNLENAIESLSRMMHRGAVAADGKSADGSGLLLSMPNEFFKKELKKQKIDLPKQYAVAMIFLTDKKQLEVFDKRCQVNGLKTIFTRAVPIDKSVLGESALKILPLIYQVFVVSNSISSYNRFDAMLYLTRKECEHELKEDENFYITSFSSKVISYKGLVMPTTIKLFYKDLQDKNFKISFALFHQRFSTNTLPKWRLAQPFRTIAHNGEINSIEANRFSALIKQEQLVSHIFTSSELKRILPILQDDISDSASLDNMFEFLIVNGVDFFKACRALVPAPWQNSPHMDPQLRAFYEYMSTCFEAWDGPAAISLTDGNYIGCLIDRNGLRPSKYIITKDDRLFVTSEYGTVDIDENNIKQRDKLKSGQMIAVDLKNGKVLKDDDINSYLKNSQNYSKWLVKDMVYLQEHIDESFVNFTDYKFEDIQNKQKFFNITYEVIAQMIEPMANEGKEPTASMGDDTPLSCFSLFHRNFTDFFRQKFAQVTNPPIDPYREKLVMSLNTGFGQMHNILEEQESFAKRIKVTSPILMKEKMDVLLSFGNTRSKRYDKYYKYRNFDTTFKTNLKASLEQLYQTIKKAILNDGIKIVVLDDRALSEHNKPIPMVMAVGYINQNLTKENLKSDISILVISGEVYDPHSCAVMISFGATAVYPYLLYGTIVANAKRKKYNKKETTLMLKNTHKALGAGIMKIMSKMGIATVASYRHSSLFDIIGLSDDIINSCFQYAKSDICGLCFDDIEKRVNNSIKDAFNVTNTNYPLQFGGIYKYLFDGEYHDFSPAFTKAINHTKDLSKVKDMIENRDKKFIRDFFEFKSDKKPIDIKEVEDIKDIFKRFDAAAMSCGSISVEAHEAIAVAMNKIGAKSNSGEGGEDPKRFNTNKNSKIKQIASGRFGVTPAYLRSADELQIKVAQGAKPGEGGQLPGSKVTAMIATLRHTTAGVTLISPPPHHDIYSIEDLSQLIFDLKQINPNAQITVKLVSTIGVGTIAAGVAKAYADKIIISGSDGGTGAAPLTSIKHTGNPWELGLSEAHNALKANDLRKFVTIQTDGGLKSGIDIVKASMLGAESFGFGTTMLTILGCKILRICHTNKCSVGVATQDESLREHFNGEVDKIVRYFEFIANDIREILASLGYKSLSDIVGRSDLLKVIDDKFASKFDFTNILRKIDGIDTNQYSSNKPFDQHKMEKKLLQKLLPTINNPKERIKIDIDINNTNRSFGALISGEIAQRYGNKGLRNDTIKMNITGVAGQSFGVFLISGIKITLNGVANDYVGKGMSGGKIIINPVHQGKQNAGAGNTCLYGATGGLLYVRASVGERFAVRNSGAIAIVEGTGDNACEYMTGGIVVTLGETGTNFGAGMTGGVAFVYDEFRNFIDNMNQELVEAIRIDTDESETQKIYLKKLLNNYIKETNSKKAKYIIENFRAQIRNFWMIKPKDMVELPLNPVEGE